MSVRLNQVRHSETTGRWRRIAPVCTGVRVRIRIVALVKKAATQSGATIWETGVRPEASLNGPAWMRRASVGKPIVLIAILAAFLMPLSNPVASSAAADSALVAHIHFSVDSPLGRQFIQQRIAHIATHPKAGVAFLTAFLTEAERLCQPNAHQNPDIPSPNATSPLLTDVSAIAMPPVLTALWRPIRSRFGLDALSQPAGTSPSPDSPPPRRFSPVI